LEKELRGLNKEQREEKLGQIVMIKEMEKSIEGYKIIFKNLLKKQRKTSRNNEAERKRAGKNG